MLKEILTLGNGFILEYIPVWLKEDLVSLLELKKKNILSSLLDY